MGSTRTRETRAEAIKRADGSAKKNRELMKELDELRQNITSKSCGNPDNLLEMPRYGIALIHNDKTIVLPAVYDTYWQAVRACASFSKYNAVEVYRETKTII